jgi:hypothetical protein
MTALDGASSAARFRARRSNTSLSQLVENGLVTVFRESPETAELVATSLRELPKDVNLYWYGDQRPV